MSLVKPPPAVKYFLAAFGPDPAALDAAVPRLSGALKAEGTGPDFGRADLSTGDLPLTETAYYEREMGSDLVKRYLTFETPAGPEHLVDLKLQAIRLEAELGTPKGRLVNLDPGYVFDGGLVLSTGKFSGHRLYLGRGVWGELTLHFHRGRFEALSWTYRDYLKGEVVDLLAKARTSLLSARKGAEQGDKEGNAHR